MQYGPTRTRTTSVLSYDGAGAPYLHWSHGLERAPVVPLPKIPRLLVVVTTTENEELSLEIPTAKVRRLVVDPAETVLEHFGSLRSSANPTHPSLDVHAVTEQRGDGLVVCTVVPSNGSCSGPSFRGCLRFKAIEIRVAEAGWHRTAIELGIPGGDYYWGIRTSTAFRFVLWKDRSQRDAAEALAKLIDLSIPNPFVGIGSGRHRMPKSWDGRRDPLYDNAPHVGPFWFDTTTHVGYDTGDSGIDPIGGWEVNASAARSYAADLPRIMARQGCALTDSETGEPFWPERWAKPSQYALYDSRYAVDPWNWAAAQGTIVGHFGWDRGNNPPSWMLPREWNAGASESRPLVLAYKPHDIAHLARVTSRALAAWQLTRSWAARWLIRMNACDVMTSYDVLVGGRLYAALASSRASPARGWEYLRAMGHAMEAVAAALSITPPGTERDRYLAWRAAMLETQLNVCLPNGFAHTGSLTQDSYNAVPWQEGLPADYWATATFQLAIWANGLYDLWTNGPPIAVPGSTGMSFLLTRGLQELEGVLGTDSKGQRSPPSWLGTARDPGPVPEVPLRVGSATYSYTGHANHELHGLALASLFTGDVRWRKKSTLYGTPFPSASGQIASWMAAPSAWTALPIAVGGAS